MNLIEITGILTIFGLLAVLLVTSIHCNMIDNERNKLYKNKKERLL